MNFYKAMYLVTGGAGFIGRCLVKRMQDDGMKVRVLSRSGAIGDMDKSGLLEFFRADLLRPESLMALTKDIDVVIHAAGMTHTFDKNIYFQVNAEGSRNLVSACKKNRVKKIIYLSTRAISRSGGAYSRSKMEAERIIKDSSLNFTILRLAEVYGGSRDEGVERLIGMIRRLPVIPVVGNGEYRLQPVYLMDAVDAIITASKSDKTDFKTYNIAGPDVFTYNDLVRSICEYMGLKRRLIHVPTTLALAISYISFFAPSRAAIYPDQIPRLVSPKEEDIGNAIEDFGYNPVGFREGLSLILAPG